MKKHVIAIASDHAGVDLKEILKRELEDMRYESVDLGTQGTQSVDYPDYATKMADWLKEHPEGRGILICGTGIGMSMAANRYRHVRAALAYSGLAAEMARKHNDANVLCLGARIIGTDMAKFCLHRFLNAEFEGERHIRRLEKIS